MQYNCDIYLVWIQKLNYLWRDKTGYPDYKAKNKFLEYQLSVLGDPCYLTHRSWVTESLEVLFDGLAGPTAESLHQAFKEESCLDSLTLAAFTKAQ